MTSRKSTPNRHLEGKSPRDARLDADAGALHRTLLELKRAYQFRDRECICCYDVSVTQCWALEALIRLESLTLNELSAELYLEKSTASRVVSALERKGYVERSRNPQDGRSVMLRATAAGSRLYGRIEAELLAQERVLLEEFDPEVRRSLIRLLGRLTDAASSKLVAEGGKCCSVA
ncbi:MAG TPA: MarR family winged helix-turn-helix transcriptional regulator [Gemmatimonadota bacterium]|nr:MarR family winged helix-turn-helix transcriptional regulator [Gemmatimonadota bacterium]